MPFQILTQGKWCDTEGAPNAGSTIERWRVKPAKSIDHWWITPGLPPTQDPKHAEQWKQENREVVFVKTSKKGSHGMTLRDYIAVHERVETTEDFSWEICEALAGPRPPGTYQSNPLEWFAWDNKWKAEVRYSRADAMLAARLTKPE